MADPGAGGGSHIKPLRRTFLHDPSTGLSSSNHRHLSSPANLRHQAGCGRQQAAHPKAGDERSRWLRLLQPPPLELPPLLLPLQLEIWTQPAAGHYFTGKPVSH